MESFSRFCRHVWFGYHERLFKESIELNRCNSLVTQTRFIFVLKLNMSVFKFQHLYFLFYHILNISVKRVLFCDISYNTKIDTVKFVCMERYVIHKARYLSLHQIIKYFTCITFTINILDVELPALSRRPMWSKGAFTPGTLFRYLARFSP